MVETPLPPPRPPEADRDGALPSESAPDAPDPTAFDPMAPEAYAPLPLPPPRPSDLPSMPGASGAQVPAGTQVPSPDGPACRAALDELGTRYEPLPPISDGVCGAPNPIRLVELPGGIKVGRGITTVCPAALALSQWTRNVLAPQAPATVGARLVRLDIGTSYQCRGRNHVVGAPLSEHGLANAFDIAGFAFEGRKAVIVSTRPAPEAEAYLEAVRKGACVYFTTVLGPGSNAEHADHLHLDVKVRRNGFRICQ